MSRRLPDKLTQVSVLFDQGGAELGDFLAVCTMEYRPRLAFYS
jgi:hypothetical protein